MVVNRWTGEVRRGGGELWGEVEFDYDTACDIVVKIIAMKRRRVW